VTVTMTIRFAAGSGRTLAIIASSGLLLAGLGAGIPAASARQAGTATATVANVRPGTQLWARRFSGPGNGRDVARDIAVSPGGGAVFVTGYSTSPRTARDFDTVAYRAGTGSPLWADRLSSLGRNEDEAQSVAVSPDGRAVFVAGSGFTAQGYTIADYRAGNGAEYWVRHYTGQGDNGARAVAVSPDGQTVFVTGTVDSEYTTIAFDTSTHAWRWVRKFADGRAQALAVSPDGSTVFVTGTSYVHVGGSAEHYRTVAYDAGTGKLLWTASYDTASTAQNDATAVAVSPDGSTVFVTGYVTGGNGTFSTDPSTVAYNAATGAQLWSSTYNAPYGRDWALAVSPDGSTVYVAGDTGANTIRSGPNYATVAYDATTGALVWESTYNGPGNGPDNARSIGVSPDGGTVYVTGNSKGKRSGDDYATIAYNAVSGVKLWVSRYNGPANGDDLATSLAVGKDGTVYVTGRSQGATSGYDYATVAYAG